MLATNMRYGNNHKDISVFVFVFVENNDNEFKDKDEKRNPQGVLTVTEETTRSHPGLFLLTPS